MTCLHHMDYVNQVCRKCGKTAAQIEAAVIAEKEETKRLEEEKEADRLKRDKERDWVINHPDYDPDDPEKVLEPYEQAEYLLPEPTYSQCVSYVQALDQMSDAGKARVIRFVAKAILHRGSRLLQKPHPDVESALKDAETAMWSEGNIGFEEYT